MYLLRSSDLFAIFCGKYPGSMVLKHFSTLMAQDCCTYELRDILCEQFYKQRYMICMPVCLLIFSLDKSGIYRNMRFLLFLIFIWKLILFFHIASFLIKALNL